jgi:hypothetical protein
LLLAVALACGATALFGIVIVWGASVYRSTTAPAAKYINLSFLADGEPILTTFNYSQSYRTAADLDGNPVELTDEKGFAAASLLPPGPPPPFRGETAWSYRIVGLIDDQKPPTFWYLIHDDQAAGHAYFEGYSAATKRRVGYIGTAGFRDEPIVPAEQFVVPFGHAWNASQISSSFGTYSLAHVPRIVNQLSSEHAFQPWLVFLNNGENVHEVNLAHRTVRLALAEPPTGIRSIDMGNVYAKTGERNWLAIRTDDAVHFLYRDAQPRVLPLAPELRGRELQIVERKEGYTVAATMNVDYQESLKHLRIYVVAADGTLGPPREAAVTDFAMPPFVYEAPLLLGSPALLVGSLLEFRPDELLALDLADSWQSAVTLAFRQYALYLIFALVAGAALAVACFRRQSRYQLSRAERIGWPIFVFLFGIPGWIGYRYCRRWAPLDVCPSCHELAPHDQDHCAVCGREFPLPEAKGTEVFA